MKLYPIETGNFKLDGGAMFGVVPKLLWARLYPADENNLCNWAMRCLLAVDGDRKMLIDTGIGGKQSEKFFSLYQLNGPATLEKSLAAHGFSASDITDVVLTHLHFDHCGGSVRHKPGTDKTQFEPAFPNALYWTSRRQWDWAVHPNRREAASFLKENILPIQESGRLRFIEKDAQLYPGFRVRLYNGHTEGQVIPFIKYGAKTVVFMGDLIPSAAHIPLPYIMGYDIRPLDALEEKERFLKEAVENNYILFFEHDLYNECCTVHDTPKGVGVAESFPLKNVTAQADRL